jgi:hypothetical protein
MARSHGLSVCRQQLAPRSSHRDVAPHVSMKIIISIQFLYLSACQNRLACNRRALDVYTYTKIYTNNYILGIETVQVTRSCRDWNHELNPIKTEFLLNNIYKSRPYLTGNTLRLHYNAQPVNAVWGNSRCLL